MKIVTFLNGDLMRAAEAAFLRFSSGNFFSKILEYLKKNNHYGEWFNHGHVTEINLRNG